MSFLKVVGITFLVLLILGGVLVSLAALNPGDPIQNLTSLKFLKDPFQALLLGIVVLLLLVFLIFLFSSKPEEEPEELIEQLHPQHIHPTDFVDEDEETIQVTYPSINFEDQQPQIESINEKIAAPSPDEPEFRRFLKNTILELEREKARIYHEVALLDEDYRKGIITETEFLTGIQLILDDKGLEEVIEEKDLQIEDCKTKLAEAGFTKKKKQE